MKSRPYVIPDGSKSTADRLYIVGDHLMARVDAGDEIDYIVCNDRGEATGFWRDGTKGVPEEVIETMDDDVYLVFAPTSDLPFHQYHEQEVLWDHQPETVHEFAKRRLEELRSELDDECISLSELSELQASVPFIENGDVQLLEAAGVPEHGRFIVDGHEFEDPESCLLGDGMHPPFMIFDQEEQRYIPARFSLRFEAETIARLINTYAMKEGAE
jgi:hypothetical protein